MHPYPFPFAIFLNYSFYHFPLPYPFTISFYHSLCHFSLQLFSFTMISIALHQRKKAPLPLLPKPPFFHALQTGTHPNERRHPYPFYWNPHLFTPCTLECTRTPFPLPFSLNIPYAISLYHIPLPYPFTLSFHHSLCHFSLQLFSFTIISI